MELSGTSHRSSPTAIFWDLDGTLADTLADLTGALNRSLAALGQPLRTATEVRRFLGEGVAVLIAQALSPAAQELAPQLVERFREDILDHCCEQTAPFPGLPPLLAELHRRGIPMAILTNKPDPVAQRVVHHLFDPTWFCAVRGQLPGVPRKPDPQVALALAERLSAPPAHCCFVGDSAVDVRTARAAGMVPVGVTWGYRDPDELIAAGARYLVGTPAELAELLLDWPG